MLSTVVRFLWDFTLQPDDSGRSFATSHELGCRITTGSGWFISAAGWTINTGRHLLVAPPFLRTGHS